jgi:hypothetical protein
VPLDDPLAVQNVPTEQLFTPRIFFCKAGKFMSKLNKDMGIKDEDMVKERIGGNEDFEKTWDDRTHQFMTEIMPVAIYASIFCRDTAYPGMILCQQI